VNYSFDVQADGNNVCRLADLMLLNKQSSIRMADSDARGIRGLTSP
jgi:hypothetical protein